MRRLRNLITVTALSIAFLFSCAGERLRAQGPNPVTPGYLICDTNSGTTRCGFQAVDLTHGLPVNLVAGSVSASIGGFVPSLSYGTLTATASSSASTALPTNTGTVAFQNNTAVTVSCTLASGAATATTNEIIVPASSTVFLGTTGYDHAACINQTGSASNVIVMAGGSGLGTGFGGGSSGGGGGGAITAALGSYASGALSAGALATGAGVDGWDLTQGAIADAAVTAGATGSISAKLRSISRDTPTLTTWAGGTLGAMASYGTSPGAVLVPGANAFVTNTNNNGQAIAANSSPVVNPVATNAGAAVVKGGVAVVNGGSTYQAVAASQTATVLQTSTGATGDYLSHCVIYPASTSPGVVTVFDNTNTAATSAILFAGGASSTSNLTPISVPVGAVSSAGAWKVTTGASVSVVCYGKFS